MRKINTYRDLEVGDYVYSHYGTIWIVVLENNFKLNLSEMSNRFLRENLTIRDLSFKLYPNDIPLGKALGYLLDKCI